MFAASAGFSLLEVLVAFTITALVLGVVFRIYGTSARAMVVSDHYAKAISIAESHLAEATVTGGGNAPRAGHVDGGYDWRINSIPYQADPGNDGNDPIVLREIRVEVAWRTLGGRRTLSLSTLMPVPRQ